MSNAVAILATLALAAPEEPRGTAHNAHEAGGTRHHAGRLVEVDSVRVT